MISKLKMMIRLNQLMRKALKMIQIKRRKKHMMKSMMRRKRKSMGKSMMTSKVTMMMSMVT